MHGNLPYSHYLQIFRNNLNSIAAVQTLTDVGMLRTALPVAICDLLPINLVTGYIRYGARNHRKVNRSAITPKTSDASRHSACICLKAFRDFIYSNPLSLSHEVNYVWSAVAGGVQATAGKCLKPASYCIFGIVTDNMEPGLLLLSRPNLDSNSSTRRDICVAYDKQLANLAHALGSQSLDPEIREQLDFPFMFDLLKIGREQRNNPSYGRLSAPLRLDPRFLQLWH
ncbi:hypothetical protein B0H17DRAFT_1132004 [Mycena rosella]|uniref:Uncharacterized protein n=1 Tax=Mycena rosella TaxID=1033263 RepID=A0AAD7GGW5_MYCRO|nr:hypothetical protein B0H17DRAFT_1132004 [Mycena rosella]